MIKRPVPYFLVIAGITFLSSCIKEAEVPNPGCDPPTSNAYFQVLDKTTGKDLFFGESPKYKVNEINVYRVKDKSFKEPLRLIPIGVDIRAFSLAFDYQRPKDTLIIKIADTPLDSLFYSVKKPLNLCNPYEMQYIQFNKDEIMADKGLMIFKK